MRTLFLFIFMINFAEAFAVKSMQEINAKNIIRQEFEESCGAASLANLINYFQLKQLNEQDVLDMISNKTDMLSFKELQNIAKSLGYTADGFRLTRDILEQTSYPILVRIEDDPRFPHFVVIINYSGDFIKILDPNFGEYISSKKEFYSIWDRDNSGGYALLIGKDNVKPEVGGLNFPTSIFFGK
ncbi:C39 family peptidase [Helicobacter sp. WB40]|nr:cysteine peptidase family C39 domain-containing protein [Helicobacter sp. WB40]MDA3967079.1 cysteine peptidase family C39 domain-containing protein [Helicobacter sp. WB40]